MTNLDLACEKCRISYSKWIISQRPIQQVETPFFQVHFDLIQMRYGLDDSYLIAHFLEDMFQMNYVYILPNKKQEIVLGTLQEFVQYVKNRWGASIKILKLDGETSLGHKFDNQVAEIGLELEGLAPYTQAQNGSIERSRGVLIRRAIALWLSTNLLEFLWLEIFIIARYLTNRSPNRTLDQKIPIGSLQEYYGVPNPKPNLAHL